MTAVEIGEATKKSIEDKLRATTDYVTFEMNYSVDKSIIGGMIIHIGDRIVDSSIKSKLESMAAGLYDVHLTT
ncbi:MAG: F0F1 ATP synthase subunit delta, partial [Lachnospiraceae bacterium]|nr:F0F1 ATP synthase subunit delta [Lachnospiraceae bacterium]